MVQQENLTTMIEAKVKEDRHFTILIAYTQFYSLFILFLLKRWLAFFLSYSAVSDLCDELIYG